MKVCICNDVSDKTIRHLLAQGYTLPEIQKMTGLSQGCGTCADYANTLVSSISKALDEGSGTYQEKKDE